MLENTWPPLPTVMSTCCTQPVSCTGRWTKHLERSPETRRDSWVQILLGPDFQSETRTLCLCSYILDAAVLASNTEISCATLRSLLKQNTCVDVVMRILMNKLQRVCRDFVDTAGETMRQEVANLQLYKHGDAKA